MDNPYESEKLLAEYLLFHYSRSEDILPYDFGPAGALDFAVRVVSECLDVGTLPPRARALDLGCAVGRSSFELARYCPEVLGIDYSRAFIRAAEAMREHGKVTFERTDEGKLATVLVAEAPGGVERQRVRFETGDACDLRDHLGQHDVVLLANLIDRLPEPMRCLSRLSGLVNPGGQLIISSPFTWLEEYTPFQHWLGGYEKNGQPVSAFETLRAVLEPDFEFIRAVDLPMLIREHARKFQSSVSKAGVWRRR